MPRFFFYLRMFMLIFISHFLNITPFVLDNKLSKLLLLTLISVASDSRRAILAQMHFILFFIAFNILAIFLLFANVLSHYYIFIEVVNLQILS